MRSPFWAAVLGYIWTWIVIGFLTCVIPIFTSRADQFLLGFWSFGPHGIALTVAFFCLCISAARKREPLP